MSLVFVVCIIVLIGVLFVGCLLMGLVMLLGLLYGDVLGCVCVLFDDVQRLGVEYVVDYYLKLVILIFGFGYYFYFDGDLCVVVLFVWFYLLVELVYFVDKVMEFIGQWLIIDVVFVMLLVQFQLLCDVVFGLFLIVCSVGLFVYCIEQLCVGRVIWLCSCYMGLVFDEWYLCFDIEDEGKLLKVGVIEKNWVFKIVE